MKEREQKSRLEKRDQLVTGFLPAHREPPEQTLPDGGVPDFGWASGKLKHSKALTAEGCQQVLS